MAVFAERQILDTGEKHLQACPVGQIFPAATPTAATAGTSSSQLPSCGTVHRQRIDTTDGDRKRGYNQAEHLRQHIKTDDGDSVYDRCYGWREDSESLNNNSTAPLRRAHDHHRRPSAHRDARIRWAATHRRSPTCTDDDTPTSEQPNAGHHKRTAPGCPRTHPRVAWPLSCPIHSHRRTRLRRPPSRRRPRHQDVQKPLKSRLARVLVRYSKTSLAPVAQGIEHGSPKASVAGSNPAGGTFCRVREFRMVRRGISLFRTVHRQTRASSLSWARPTDPGRADRR